MRVRLKRKSSRLTVYTQDIAWSIAHRRYVRMMARRIRKVSNQFMPWAFDIYASDGRVANGRVAK